MTRPPPPPPPPPDAAGAPVPPYSPGWYLWPPPDSGAWLRFDGEGVIAPPEYRYWDGSAWSDHGSFPLEASWLRVFASRIPWAGVTLVFLIVVIAIAILWARGDPEGGEAGTTTTPPAAAPTTAAAPAQPVTTQAGAIVGADAPQACPEYSLASASVEFNGVSPGTVVAWDIRAVRYGVGCATVEVDISWLGVSRSDDDVTEVNPTGQLCYGIQGTIQGTVSASGELGGEFLASVGQFTPGGRNVTCEAIHLAGETGAYLSGASNFGPDAVTGSATDETMNLAATTDPKHPYAVVTVQIDLDVAE